MSEKRCENPAYVRRYWPGKDPDLVCIEHAAQSKRIADAMGFHLVLEPIRPDDLVDLEWPPCSNFVSEP